MKLYGPGRGPVVRLSRLLRVEGLAIESALFRVGRPLKHRREEFYARRVIQPPARPRARTQRTFFLVVCHRDARDLSLSAFLIAPTISSRAFEV